MRAVFQGCPVLADLCCFMDLGVPSGAHLDCRQGLAAVALLGANVDVVRLNRVRSVAFLCRLIVVLKGKVGACGENRDAGRGRSQHRRNKKSAPSRESRSPSPSP